MSAPEILVWAYERLLSRLGWLKVAAYDARHRVTPAKMKAALAGRVQNVGIQHAEAPDPEAETVQINPGVVQAIASLRQWKREQDTKTTVAVIEHETGIGILKPVVDFPVEEPTVALTIDGVATCSAALGAYDCELVDDGHDTHSACGGDITWPRAEMAVAQ